ncbi:MAG: acyltransferase family protein [Bryobacterales bacterium]|nr:acyltransferase family protein [Bryobacterales bacterium]
MREHGLDWLRVAAFAVLIFYHSGMIYVPWGFHIKNPETSNSLALAMLFFNRWRLPLLFFISGCGVAFSLRRRSPGAFARERIWRLLLPLAFGMFVVIPPQIYVERLQKGATFTYAEFYPEVLRFVPYPAGAFSWHHLWFVAYLLVYSLAAIPLFGLLRRFGAAFAGWVTRWPAAFYLINAPSMFAAYTLGPHWPTTHNLIADWANLTGSFITFLWGFVFASTPALLDLVERRRREFLYGGVIVAALFYALRLSGAAVPFAVGFAVNAYFGFFWIFLLVGYARARIKTGGPWLAYATEAVYPFYILHQTILVVFGYWLVQQPWSIAAKLGITMAVTFSGSWAGFELIRRSRFLRPLFGLR